MTEEEDVVSGTAAVAAGEVEGGSSGSCICLLLLFSLLSCSSLIRFIMNDSCTTTLLPLPLSLFPLLTPPPTLPFADAAAGTAGGAPAVSLLFTSNGIWNHGIVLSFFKNDGIPPGGMALASINDVNLATRIDSIAAISGGIDGRPSVGGVVVVVDNTVDVE